MKIDKDRKELCRNFLGVHGVPGDDLHRRQYPEPKQQKKQSREATK